jgi:Pyruvate/2-oxoacid:ferredoxin oxidoreductase gamma subunit
LNDGDIGAKIYVLHARRERQKERDINMPTNTATVGALKRVSELIDELSAWNVVLKKHAAEQSKQTNDFGDEYIYDRNKNVCVRVKTEKLEKISSDD